MNFDLTDGQIKRKEELATLFQQTFQNFNPSWPKDLSLILSWTRRVLEKIGPLDYYQRIGLSPEQTRESPYTGALDWVLLA